MAASETSSAGGVILTAQSSERPTVGEVVAVGPGHKDEKTEEVKKVNCEKGQQVLYSRYSGMEFEEDDDTFVVIRETDVLAVLS